MSFIRRLDTHLKIYACFAVLLCLSTALSLWLLGQLGQIDAGTAGAAQKLSVARGWTWLWLAAIGAAGAVLALWLRAETARPVLQAAAMARKVARGDLSTRGGAGEGGALLLTMQEMNDNLAGMILKVRAGTESIAGSAGQIASGSMALSASSGEQAASLEQAAAAMAQLSAAARRNAGHAHQAGKLALSASEMTAKGGAAVAEMAGTMASINDAAQRIAEIINLIDAIAFQTNTLALNAQADAKAARAGEAGRGLALMAADVRNLAQRSAGAARQIKRLIDDSADQASAGTLLACNASEAMHDVAASVKRVTAIIGEVADASAVQAAGIEQVDQAIAAMDQASRHNATLLEQATAAAVAMRDQAGSLSRATGAFVLGPGHPSTAPAIHLVASNPNKLSKPRPARLAPMRVVPAPPAAPAGHVQPAAGLRSGGAARRGLDWVDF